MADRLSISSRTFLGQVWELSAPYWRSEEKASAWLLLATIVAMTLGLVYMLVLLNDWNRQFFDALEKKNSEDFFALMIHFCFLAAVYVTLAIYRAYLQQMLEVRWRIWLTRQSRRMARECLIERRGIASSLSLLANDNKLSSRGAGRGAVATSWRT